MDAVETLKESGRDVVRVWPLLGVRLAEQLAMTVVVVGCIFAFLIPLVISGVFAAFSSKPVENQTEAVDFLASHAWLVVLFFLAIFVAITLAMVVHAFVQAGVVGEFLALDRRPRPLDWREGIRNFSLERFLRAAKDGWWSAFWIFQIVWASVSLVLLLPLIVTIVMMYSRGIDEHSIAVGCGGLVITLLVALPLSIFAGTWSQASLICAVRDRLRAVEATTAGWRELVSRLSDTLTLLLLFCIVSFAIFAGAVGLTFGIEAISRYPMVALMLFPLRLALIFVQTLFSLFMSNWFVAAIVRLVDREQITT